MADSILKVSGLRKSYRKKIILNNVSFEVHSGEIIGIVGANGCGKSTLLRMLAGADKPDTGLIEYGGLEVMKQRNEEKAKILNDFLDEIGRAHV